jgi:hypothetical protein
MQFFRQAGMGVALVLSVVSTAVPRDAHALAGLLSANPVMIAVGAVGTLGAATLTVYSGVYSHVDPQSTPAKLGLWGGIGLIILGVVVLDGEKTGDARFAPLTAEQASALSLTSAQWDAYEANREELNALLEQGQAELAGLDRATAFAQAVEFWRSEGVSIDADAREVAGRIVRAAMAP